MTSAPPGAPGSPAGPPLSPDGSHWWDGQAWHPMPGAPARRSVKSQVLRGLVVGLLLVGGLGGWAAWQEMERQAQFESDLSDAYCARFGADEPRCQP